MIKLTRQKAINAKCKDCAYDPFNKGTWRQQVENCGCPDCPLYLYRPIPLAAKKQRKFAESEDSAPEAADWQGEEQLPPSMRLYSAKNSLNRDVIELSQDGNDGGCHG